MGKLRHPWAADIENIWALTGNKANRELVQQLGVVGEHRTLHLYWRCLLREYREPLVLELTRLHVRSAPTRAKAAPILQRYRLTCCLWCFTAGRSRTGRIGSAGGHQPGARHCRHHPHDVLAPQTSLHRSLLMITYCMCIGIRMMSPASVAEDQSTCTPF